MSFTRKIADWLVNSRLSGWLLRKSTIASFDTVTVADVYKREGFHRISELLGGGYSSYSGKVITLDAAFESAALYAGTKMIAEDMGGLPFEIHRRSVDRTAVEKAWDDHRYPILHYLANPETSAGEFVEALTANAILCRGGYALKVRARSSGKLLFLYQLNPQGMRIDHNAVGQQFFIYKDGNSQEKTYANKDIFHLKGFSFDGENGEDLLSRGRHVLGLTLSPQEYAARFFANDASAGVILKRPQGAPALSAEGLDLLKKAWVRSHQGAALTQEPTVVQEGMEVTRVDPDHQKLQLVDQRKFQVIEVCRLLRLPPHMLADLDRAHFNNIESENRAYGQRTLSPWCRRWSDAFYRCLLSRDEQIEGRLYAEHNIEGLLQGDFKTQAEGFAKLLEKGVYSVNEVRRWMNLNPVEGGDKHFIQLNMQTISDAASGVVQDEGSKLMEITGGTNEGNKATQVRD
jgi:HK97 family phage portal protein